MSLLSTVRYVCAALDPCAPVGAVDCERHSLSQRARDGALFCVLGVCAVCAGTACVWQLGARVWGMCSPPPTSSPACLWWGGECSVHRMVPMRRRGPCSHIPSPL